MSGSYPEWRGFTIPYSTAGWPQYLLIGAYTIVAVLASNFV